MENMQVRKEDALTHHTAACTKRESNIELFRIIVMLLIVAHHYVVNSGLYGVIQNTPLCLRSVFLLLFGAWGKTGINCFVLISGYFMCQSKLTWRKFVKLLFEFQFYKLVFYICFLIAGYESFSFARIIKVLAPITVVNTGFTGCYLLFLLLIPFLNILTKHMTQKQHLCLIAVGSFVYVGLGTLSVLTSFFPWFPTIGVTMNYVSWFVVLYFFGAYIRMYPKTIYENTKLWGWLTVLLLAISVASVVACAYIGNMRGRVDIALSYAFLSDCSKVLAVAVAVCAFLFFRTLKIPYNKYINAAAASTYGVLLIHANSDAMRKWLWIDTLKNGQMFTSVWMPLHALGSVLVIFAVCIAIDRLRIRYIETPFLNWWDKLIEKRRNRCD